MSAFADGNTDTPPAKEVKIIRYERILPCTQQELWDKFTTSEGLITFFGADNCIELRRGGKYEIYFLLDAPEGSRGGEGNKIISFLPREQLSFTWNAPPQFAEVRNNAHRTWVLLTFNRVNDNVTQIVLSHTGWLQGGQWDEVFDYFSQAWLTVLDSLEKCFEDRNCDMTPSSEQSDLSAAQSRIEYTRRRTKAGADAMRALGLEAQTTEFIVRADELELQARHEAFSFLTTGYPDEHH